MFRQSIPFLLFFALFATARADELKVGEGLRNRDGTIVRVLSVTQRPGVHTVYNLEVQLDHVYHVGSSGVLVHNGGVCPKTFFGKSADDLSKAGRVLDPADKAGQLTKAGRSLAKHQAGARPGSTKFPKAKGNPATINQQAQGVLDDILENPNTTFTQGHRFRFGDTIEAIAPDGRGVVFDANGNFLFFAEFY